jgi:hypothetical protein
MVPELMPVVLLELHGESNSDWTTEWRPLKLNWITSPTLAAMVLGVKTSPFEPTSTAMVSARAPAARARTERDLI